MDDPYKTIRENIVYSNPRYGFDLHDDDVVTPTGKQGKYMYLEGNGFVMVVAVTEDLRVIMVRQYRYSVQSYSLEVIGETANKSETPLENAKRGLMEEAGVGAYEWKDLGWHWLGIGIEKVKCTIFLARIKNDVKLRAEIKKEVVFYPLSEVMKMVRKNEIISGDTQLALLTAKNYLG